jgi:hypothetical protein
MTAKVCWPRQRHLYGRQWCGGRGSRTRRAGKGSVEGCYAPQPLFKDDAICRQRTGVAIICAVLIILSACTAAVLSCLCTTLIG